MWQVNKKVKYVAICLIWVLILFMLSIHLACELLEGMVCLPATLKGQNLKTAA